MTVYKGTIPISVRGGDYPDWSNPVVITTSGYSCPGDGWICISMNGQTHSTNEIYINGTLISAAYAINNYQESCCSAQVPVKQGDVISWVGTIVLCKFFKLR